MLTTLTRGIMMDWNGMIMEATNRPNKPLLKRVGVRIILWAAIALTTTSPALARTVIRSEFPNTRGK
ncbi:hypothetical protein D3C80_2039330 [compost metagenome]